jgi:hypothetical protein
MSPPTQIFVVITRTIYELPASQEILNFHTNRDSAEEHARTAGGHVQVYLRHEYASRPTRYLCIR